jgi:hypothetical protein
MLSSTGMLFYQHAAAGFEECAASRAAPSSSISLAATASQTLSLDADVWGGSKGLGADGASATRGRYDGSAAAEARVPSAEAVLRYRDLQEGCHPHPTSPVRAILTAAWTVGFVATRLRVGQANGEIGRWPCVRVR